MVATHVDDVTRRRIINNEYVDFARLLPCDRLSVEEDNHLELVNRDGQAFYVPAVNRELGQNAISSFNCWELAFWVFADIYLRHHPH